MITEIILVIFAIVYYLFSLFLFTTIIDANKASFGLFLIMLVLSPIAAPIMLGIELGEWIKNN